MIEKEIAVSSAISSRACRHDWCGWVAFYIVTLLAIATFQTIPFVEVWGHNLVEAARNLPYGDPNSFATAAIDVSSTGWITEKTRWIFNLWPPGFVLLEAGLLNALGGNTPMPLILLVISAGLFAAVMVEMRRNMPNSFGRWAGFAPLVIFCLSEARTSLLSPTGLLFGEWLAIGCFFLAILSVMRSSWKAAVFAGLLFAVSAYTRSQFELFLDVMLLSSVGVIIVIQYFNKSQNVNGWQAGKFLLTALVVAQVAMLPWRLYHWHDGNGLRWVSTGDVIAANGLATDKALKEKNGSFVVLGGGNVACHIAPEHCGETSSRTFFKIFLEHPIIWIQEKAQFIPRFWFAPTGTLTTPHTSPDLLDVILGSVSLICIFLAISLLWFIRKKAIAQLWGSVGLGLLVAHFFIIVFAHLEARYFFFIKIYGIFSLLLLLAPLRGHFSQTMKRNISGNSIMQWTQGRNE
jgi:hypothetical protein